MFVSMYGNEASREGIHALLKKRRPNSRSYRREVL